MVSKAFRQHAVIEWRARNFSVRRRIIASSVAVAVSVLAVGCSSAGSVLDSADQAVANTLTVSAGVGTAGEVLGEIYAQALRRTGTDVHFRPGPVQRGEYLAALDGGEVDLVPEFSGSLLIHLQPGTTTTEPDEVYAELSRSLPQGISVSDFAGAQDGAVLAVPRTALGETVTLSEFAPRCAASTLAHTPGWMVAAQPPKALAEIGCVFADATEFDVLAEPSAGVVFGLTTADPAAADPDLVVLADSEQVLIAQNVLPVFRSDAISDRHRNALALVAGELTTTDLAEMISQVRSGRPSADVAREWLDAHL